VRESNHPALKLYRGLGFRHEHVRPDYYEHPVENAVVMTLDADGMRNCINARSDTA
jgi:ribosomal protein S18 acetylase RimI-like enzyme